MAELESALSEAREKGEVAAAAKDEIDRLRSQLVHTQGKLRVSVLAFACLFISSPLVAKRCDDLLFYSESIPC